MSKYTATLEQAKGAIDRALSADYVAHKYPFGNGIPCKPTHEALLKEIDCALTLLTELKDLK